MNKMKNSLEASYDTCLNIRSNAPKIAFLSKYDWGIWKKAEPVYQ